MPPELEVSLPSNKSAFRFATFVVEATTNGAVPVDNVELTTPANVETPDTLRFLAVNSSIVISSDTYKSPTYKSLPVVTIPVNVETPDTFKFLVEISEPKVVSPTLSSPAMNTSSENVDTPTNVERPDTFNCCASKSVADVIPRVETPDTLNVSVSV